MGCDINFYCVKKVMGSAHHYQLYPPIRFQSISTGARARQWEDLFYFQAAPQYRMTDLDLSWLKYHQDSPEELDECEPEQTFDGRGVVFDPQLILTDVLRVKAHIERNVDDLPSDHHYQVHHADPSKRDVRSALRMWRTGELWGFESGWNQCEGWPITLKADENERYVEESPDLSRILHGWAFPEGGLEGYVLRHTSLWSEIQQEQARARRREDAGDPPERVTWRKISYAERYSDALNNLIEVCELALQHHCMVLVEHNY